MKKSIKRLLKNYIVCLMPKKNYLVEEIKGMTGIVEKKMAEMNCRRIVACAPFLCVMYVVNLISLFRVRGVLFLEEALCISVVLFVITFIAVGIIIWLMFFNRIDNEQEIWKFKIIHKFFWSIWFILMASISFIQMKNAFLGVCIII